MCHQQAFLECVAFIRRQNLFQKPQKEFPLYVIGQNRVIQPLHVVRESMKAATLKKKCYYYNWLSILSKQTRIMGKDLAC